MNHIMLINLHKMAVVKVVETEDQGFYWADILCPGLSYYVGELSISGFKSFSELELKKLYNNAFGENPRKIERPLLVGGLLTLGDNNCKADLIDHTTVQELHAKLGHEPQKPTCIPIIEKREIPKATPKQRSRSSGVRDTIYQVANRIWDEAGSPMEPQTVRRLRLTMMDELETMGVKRTTASGQLGNWQKETIHC